MKCNKNFLSERQGFKLNKKRRDWLGKKKEKEWLVVLEEEEYIKAFTPRQPEEISKKVISKIFAIKKNC